MGETSVNFREVVRKGMMLRGRSLTYVVTEVFDDLCLVLDDEGDTGTLYYGEDNNHVSILYKNGKPAVSKRNIFGQYTFKAKRG